MLNLGLELNVEVGVFSAIDTFIGWTHTCGLAIHNVWVNRDTELNQPPFRASRLITELHEQHVHIWGESLLESGGFRLFRALMPDSINSAGRKSLATSMARLLRFSSTISTVLLVR